MPSLNQIGQCLDQAPYKNITKFSLKSHKFYEISQEMGKALPDRHEIFTEVFDVHYKYFYQIWKMIIFFIITRVNS